MLVAEQKITGNNGHGDARIRWIQTGHDAYAVTAYLPAGISNMPEVARFSDYESAQRCYRASCDHWERKLKRQ